MGFDDDVDIIMSQTGIEDREAIENCYTQTNYSIADTIMQLMNYHYAKKTIDKPKTVIDDVREILESKEKVYYEVFESLRKQHGNEMVSIKECNETEHQSS